MKSPLSECCKAKINVSEDDLCPDLCSHCGELIRYGLMCYLWAQCEACGVAEGFDGKLFFFWAQDRNWHSVENQITDGQIYLGQIRKVVSTISMQYRISPDLIPSKLHQKFLNDWKSKVTNPEIVDLFEK